MNNDKKPHVPEQEERGVQEVNTMKNPLALQIFALCIQILAFVIILTKK